MQPRVKKKKKKLSWFAEVNKPNNPLKTFATPWHI